MKYKADFFQLVSPSIKIQVHHQIHEKYFLLMSCETEIVSSNLRPKQMNPENHKVTSDKW